MYQLEETRRTQRLLETARKRAELRSLSWWTHGTREIWLRVGLWGTEQRKGCTGKRKLEPKKQGNRHHHE